MPTITAIPSDAVQVMTQREKLVLALLCTTQFMIVLDGVIMNVAIASIQEALGLSPQALQWVINAYTLAFGGFLLLGGRAADLLGKRRVLMVGIGLFTLASLIGGLAYDGTVLIIARAFQGLGAALASPASMSLVAEMFEQGKARDRAFGAMGAIAAAGAASGVLLGGLLTGLFGWESVLLINVPIGLAVMVAAYRLLPNKLSNNNQPTLDLAGATAVTSALVVTVYAIVSAPAVGWGSAQTIGLIGLSLALVGVFVWIELRTLHPLVQFTALQNRRLLSALTTGLVHAAGPMTVMYFLSLYLQQHMGYSPLQTGLAFLPLSVMAAVGALVSGKLVGRVGTLSAMLAGLLTMAAGLVTLAMMPNEVNFVLHLLPGIMLVGLGITLAAVPMTITAMSAVSAQDTGLASGLLNTSQQIGAALNLALLVAVVSASTSLHETTVGAASTTRWVLAAASAVLVTGTLLAWCVAPSNSSKQTST
jgi:EmrB/QacA subfamily drug resistance transporter